MLLEAMVTESTMDDLLEEMKPSEIISTQLVNTYPTGEKIPLIGAQVDLDRLLEIAQRVGASLTDRDLMDESLNRLVVTSHPNAPEYITDNYKTEICYWSTSYGETL